MNKIKDNEHDYDSIEEGYYDVVMKNGAGAQSKWHELKFKKIYRILEIENPGKLLDVACGPGTFISAISHKFDCYGVDIAQKQVDYANKKYGGSKSRFFKCDNNKYPFDDHVFDIVTSIEFAEHISKDSFRKNLNEMRRCLKKRGKLILTTPNYKSTWPLLEYIVSHITKENYLKQHITHYNKKSIKDIMLESGFVNVKVESYIFLSPFFAYFGDNFSNWLFDIEDKYFNKLGFGNLLIAIGEVDHE